jgi:hypothetical protein
MHRELFLHGITVAPILWHHAFPEVASGGECPAHMSLCHFESEPAGSAPGYLEIGAHRIDQGSVNVEQHGFCAKRPAQIESDPRILAK